MRAENWMKAGCVALLPSVEVAMVLSQKVPKRRKAVVDDNQSPGKNMAVQNWIQCNLLHAKGKS